MSPMNSTRDTMGLAAARAFMAQPSRTGSTKVPSPTLVSTPGRRAAVSRVMSNNTPEGTFQAATRSSTIICQIAGIGSDEGPDG